MQIGSDRANRFPECHKNKKKEQVSFLLGNFIKNPGVHSYYFIVSILVHFTVKIVIKQKAEYYQVVGASGWQFISGDLLA